MALGTIWNHGLYKHTSASRTFGYKLLSDDTYQASLDCSVSTMAGVQ